MKFRLKAAGIHLLISAVVAFIGLYLVFFVWHPDPLQKIVGVTHIFLIMMGVDVTLGPILTLIVASSPQKKTLKTDLLVICIIQVAAYVYGMSSIIQSRPVYIAFDRIRFEVVQADTVVRDTDKKIAPEFLQNPMLQPQWVNVIPFKDDKERNERTFTEMQTGVSSAMRVDLYQPIDAAWPIIAQNKHQLVELNRFNEQPLVREELAKYPQADSYMPLKGPAEAGIVLLDSRQHRILGISTLSPE